MVVPGNNVIEGNIEDEVDNFAARRKGRAFCKKKLPMPNASAFLSLIKTKLRVLVVNIPSEAYHYKNPDE